ncbi:hypothetical protein HKD37_13G037290 [Glycine soja]
MNSKVAIDFITKGVSVFHPYYLLVEQIRSFMTMQGHIMFSHCYKENNYFCADALAKKGAQNDSLLTVWF